MENIKFLTNETGVFGVDDEGTLHYFEAEKARDEHILKRLIIPEGVVTIPDDSFRYYVVLWELKFPDSLKVLGTNDGCAFANCHLPDVILPKGLEKLGMFSFGSSVMRSLSIPKELRSTYLRQFKGAEMETLYLPRELEGKQGVSYMDLDDETGRGFLHSLSCGDIHAKRIVFGD